MMTLAQLNEYAQGHRGGFTVDIETGRPPEAGFAVSITNGMYMGQAWQAAVYLTTQTGPRVYIGGWIDDRWHEVIDVTYVVPTLALARNMARFYNQDAIYDIKHHRNISCRPQLQEA